MRDELDKKKRERGTEISDEGVESGKWEVKSREVGDIV